MKQRVKRLVLTVATFTTMAMLAGAIIGCNGNIPPLDCRALGCDPGNTCQEIGPDRWACRPAPCTPGSCPRDMNDPQMCKEGECVACEPDLSGAIWNTDAGDVVCSTPERPVKHWPAEEECPLLTKPCGAPPPLPQPQCLGDSHCDCYVGQDWLPCQEPPPSDCGFPQGAPNSDFTGTTNPGTFGSVVNSVMADLSGCAVGTDCPITFGPDPWMALVCDRLCEIGLNCGRHDDEPPGATDQISVKRGSFCDGKAHENYQIYNYGGKKVRWAPGGQQDGWILNPNSEACQGAPPPPPQDCPPPHPDLTRMKFQKHEKGSHLDTTWITVGQPNFCAKIGYCCMPGTGSPPNTCGSPGCIPRGGCPVRGDGNPIRPKCEAELCNQKWTCNGQAWPPYRGNPAQTDCRGHYKTWCSASGSTAVLEGDR